jgi:hypothetical protein
MMKTELATKVLKETLKYKKSEHTKCQRALVACLDLYNHQWNTGVSGETLVRMEQAIQSFRTRESELRSYIATLQEDLAK